MDLEAGNKLKVMAINEKTGEYVLVNAKTYKVSESGNVKLTVQMSKKLDMDNVAKITYSTSKKSVAAVSKNGQITGKNTGSADITAKVILNNGKTKTVKMRITVR